MYPFFGAPPVWIFGGQLIGLMSERGCARPAVFHLDSNWVINILIARFVCLTPCWLARIAKSSINRASGSVESGGRQHTADTRGYS